MYVCICAAVTERDIRLAAADGCHHLRQLRHKLGIITQCGRCAHQARHVLHEALREQHPHLYHHHHHPYGKHR